MGDYNPSPNPLGLTAPDGADPIRNGDNRLRALVDDLSANMALVNALPGSPEDGQLVYFQDVTLAAEGIVWPLRFNAGSASAHKWEPVGAPVAQRDEILAGTVAGELMPTSYGALGVAGEPAINPPLDGEYTVRVGFTYGIPSGSSPVLAWMSPAGSGIAAADELAAIVTTEQHGDNMENQISHEQVLELIGGDPLGAAFKRAGATMNARRCWLSITPRRVG